MKSPQTHIHRSATNSKNICFVEYKHKVLRIKVVSGDATQKRLILDAYGTDISAITDKRIKSILKKQTGDQGEN
ncbi:hypothetical protein [Prevotella rectalis]|uniref:hypothetical protein n=1 Tax=Prevotella rectalis TaxID=2219999 RepID=UPI0013EF3404|nr:hypothetical protein [Prevotella brunnea]